MALHAETLDEAVRNLAQRVAPHLAANETARVEARNLSPLADAEIPKAQAALQRALRKRVRRPVVVDVLLTISENVKGYLLVAEIRKGEQREVEMVRYQPDAAPPVEALLPLEKRLVWEQAGPILDLALSGDRLLVLSPEQVTRYQRLEGRWNARESASVAAPPMRDPRGRMEVANGALKVSLPGAACEGTVDPLSLDCEPDTTGLAPAAAPASLGDTVAACGTEVLASGPGPMDAEDTVALYDISGSQPAALSETVRFRGPVTALWPAAGGSLAVIRNLSTGRYEAYLLTVDCDR